jgi:peptidoglycan-N-acetylglucosamine deacetylase
MYLVKTPYLLKKIYPSLIWDMPDHEKVIYLTFDDGPIPEATPFVLQQLKKYNAKATFFCIGDNVRKYPHIFEQLKKDGHTIGNHTFNHLNGWYTEDEKYLDNILKCDNYFKYDLFRPPYGRITQSQISNLKSHMPNLKVIMWDVLSGDFDTSLSPRDCLRKVIRKTEQGSIVVFHDSIKAFPRLKHTLPIALKYWKDKGYTFKSIE